MPYLTDVFYNAASNHSAGLQAQHAVMKSRMEIAEHVGAKMNEIVFTSGATEAINLCILGAARQASQSGSQRNRIVTVPTEHAAVRDAAQYCAERGFDVVWLPVDSDGRVEIEAVRQAVNDKTILLSVMAVNNETGVKQDLATLSSIAHEHGALFMTDATQAYGKMEIDVDALGIDLMTFSGHKIYGPKGVGALFTRSRKNLTCELEPLMYGGGQERGIRSGTLNVPSIVGMACAGSIAIADLEQESQRISSMRNRFEQAMLELPGVTINSADAPRSFAISNTFFCHADAELLILSLPHIACSRGSACSSAKPKPSPVLSAMGRTPEQANRSLRFSFGRMTTEADVDRLINDIHSAYLSFCPQT